MENENLQDDVNTLKQLNELDVSQNVNAAKLSKTPIQDVEESLGSFTKHTFEIVKDEYEFQKSIESEIQARLQLDPKDGGFTSKELIALHTNNSVNLNDRISKILGPTFTLMTEEVRAEINARTSLEKQQAAVNINLGSASPDNMRIANETCGNGNKDDTQAILQGLNQLFNIINSAGIKTPTEKIEQANKQD